MNKLWNLSILTMENALNINLFILTVENEQTMKPVNFNRGKCLKY